MTTGPYTVAEVEDMGEAPCRCDSCQWTGPASLTKDIEACALKPGDQSPVGRCPTCDALCYPGEVSDSTSNKMVANPQTAKEKLERIDNLRKSMRDRAIDNPSGIKAETLAMFADELRSILHPLSS